MIAALDVHYFEDGTANAAAVVFHDWNDAEPAAEYSVRLDGFEPYEPGAFYRRELPCLRAVLAEVGEPLEVVVIDGYVWLSADRRPGLGAHLADEVDGGVVGVAKNPFKDAEAFAQSVVRGGSSRPLYVTAAGLAAEEAARFVAEMHGEHRFPTLLRRVDMLARER